MKPIRLRFPLARYTGYGKGATALLRKLSTRDDIDFELKPIRNEVSSAFDSDDAIRLMVSDTFTNASKDIGILLGPAPNLDVLDSRYKILYSIYETNDIPKKWIPFVKKADEIWVPSKFCGYLFAKYNPNIRLVPWGFDESFYNKNYPDVVNDCFTFASVGVMGIRKGTDILVSAFKSAFPNNNGVRLIIKTRDTRWLPEISDDRITVIDDNFDEYQMVDFYHSADCIVQPTRGEGFGVPAIEAAACGTPALVTNWSGPTDYIDNNGIWGINILPDLVRVQPREMSASHSKWAEPSKQHLIYLMKWVYATRPKVNGDYSKFNISSMADNFVAAVNKARVVASLKNVGGK